MLNINIAIFTKEVVVHQSKFAFLFFAGSSDHIISHPDEMENLEQYRVIADYERKDNHQVDLKAGEVVHVIEKHDTGKGPSVYDSKHYIECPPN